MSLINRYNKMLRLLKRYKFGYHVNDDCGAERVPTNSIAMSSYPGALSSQDEYYIISGKENQDLIITGRPLRTSNMKKQVDNEIINTLNKNYESVRIFWFLIKIIYYKICFDINYIIVCFVFSISSCHQQE